MSDIETRYQEALEQIRRLKIDNEKLKAEIHHESLTHAHMQSPTVHPGVTMLMMIADSEKAGYVPETHFREFGDVLARFASRMVDSAVGPKQATLIFGLHDHQIRVVGQFDSEGRNVLESLNFFVPKGTPPEDALKTMQEYLERTDHAIRRSYAVSLYEDRLDTPASEPEDSPSPGPKS